MISLVTTRKIVSLSIFLAGLVLLFPSNKVHAEETLAATADITECEAGYGGVEFSLRMEGTMAFSRSFNITYDYKVVNEFSGSVVYTSPTLSFPDVGCEGWPADGDCYYRVRINIPDFVAAHNTHYVIDVENILYEYEIWDPSYFTGYGLHENLRLEDCTTPPELDVDWLEAGASNTQCSLGSDGMEFQIEMSQVYPNSRSYNIKYDVEVVEGEPSGSPIYEESDVLFGFVTCYGNTCETKSRTVSAEGSPDTNYYAKFKNIRFNWENFTTAETGTGQHADLPFVQCTLPEQGDGEYLNAHAIYTRCEPTPNGLEYELTMNATGAETVNINNLSYTMLIYRLSDLHIVHTRYNQTFSDLYCLDNTCPEEMQVLSWNGTPAFDESYRAVFKDITYDWTKPATGVGGSSGTGIHSPVSVECETPAGELQLCTPDLAGECYPDVNCDNPIKPLCSDSGACIEDEWDACGGAASCGTSGNDCCLSGDPCINPNLVCNDEFICEPCGGFDQQCCPGAVPCTGGLQCLADVCFGEEVPDPTDYTGPLVDFQKLLTALRGVMIPIGIAVFGLPLIAVNAYKLMTSQGDPAKVKDAREGLTAAILGIVFLLLSLTLLRIIINSLLSTSL